ALATGQAIVIRNDRVDTAQMRVRHTFHAGATPGLDETAAPELRKVDAAMLAELQKLMAASESAVKEANSEKARLVNRIARLEQENKDLAAAVAERDAQIAQLEAEVKRLRVHADSLRPVSAPAPNSLPGVLATLNVEQIRTDQIITAGAGDQVSPKGAA